MKSVLFVKRRGTIRVGQVHHVPYQVKRATVLEIRDDLIGAAGLPPISTRPELAHFCDGVEVEVFGIRSDVNDRDNSARQSTLCNR